jgi:hypothetical protein
MDISPAAAVQAVEQMRQAQDTQQVQVAVLKKAMDVQSSAALALLQAVPGPLPLASSGPLGTQLNLLA